MDSTLKRAEYTWPVHVFHEKVKELDLAIVIARASPRKKFVHDLRTAARSVEAQLTLISFLGRLPAHEDEADEVRKRLKKVRRASSVVRDLDVQRNLIQEDISVGLMDKSMRHDAKRLRHELNKQRRQQALGLVQVLCEEGPRLMLSLLLLEEKLAPAMMCIVDTKQMTTLIGRWFFHDDKRSPSNFGAGRQTGNLTKIVRSVGLLKKRSLHDLRKAAKLGRYMVDGLLTESSAAKTLADQFEAIHQAGGLWHDRLLLAEIAAKREGNDARLTRQYVKRECVMLTEYRAHLVDVLGGPDARFQRKRGSLTPRRVATKASSRFCV